MEVLVLIITGLILLALKIAKPNLNETSSVNNQPSASTPPEEIEFPPTGYTYYEMVGMYHNGITPKDFGVFKGKAIAETNNLHDKFAVGIYRDSDNKLVGHLPKDFRGVSNEKMHKEILESGGSRDVIFKISGNENRCYGTVYIKNR